MHKDRPQHPSTAEPLDRRRNFGLEDTTANQKTRADSEKWKFRAQIRVENPCVCIHPVFLGWKMVKKTEETMKNCKNKCEKQMQQQTKHAKSTIKSKCKKYNNNNNKKKKNNKKCTKQ